MPLPAVRSVVVCLALAASLLTAAGRCGAEERSTSFDEISLYERLDRYERRRYEGLRYLMNDHQKRQYLNLPTRAERDEWVLKFWRMLDPTPATGENERRKEHEQRVAAARERFAKADFPGWDHRGETLIRFGEPDNITPVSADLIDAETSREYFKTKMPGEVWTYARLGMRVPFEQVSLDGTYSYYMEIRSATRFDRGKLGTGEFFTHNAYYYLQEQWDYDPSNVDRLNFAAVPELLTFYSLLEDNRCVHAADLDMVPLSCYFDLTSFRGGPGTVRADVNLEIPARELAFREDPAGWRATFEVKVAAYDLDMREVLAVSREVDLSRRGPMPRDSLWLYPAQLNLAIEPGYYRWGIEVIDRAGGKHGCYSFSRLLEPIGTEFSLSDILFASSIRSAGEGEAFVRGTLRVVPHPVHAYRKPQPVRFYFEIYGLDTDPQGFAFYSIEYRIEAKEKRRIVPIPGTAGTEIRPRFETSGYGETQFAQLEIETDRLHEGSYRLVVAVMDRRTRETVEKIANFSILDE